MDRLQPFMPWIIQVAAGAVGGNVVGLLRGARSLGPLMNSILGAAGGAGAVVALQRSGNFELLTRSLAGNYSITLGVFGGMGGFLLSLLASLFKRGS